MLNESERYQDAANGLEGGLIIYLFIYLFIYLLCHHTYTFIGWETQQLLPITAAPIVIQKQFTRYTKHTQ
jgi:hypothetical protein